jgi:hypothetical protein
MQLTLCWVNEPLLIWLSLRIWYAQVWGNLLDWLGESSSQLFLSCVILLKYLVEFLYGHQVEESWPHSPVVWLFPYALVILKNLHGSISTYQLSPCWNLWTQGSPNFLWRPEQDERSLHPHSINVFPFAVALTYLYMSFFLIVILLGNTISVFLALGIWKPHKHILGVSLALSITRASTLHEFLLVKEGKLPLLSHYICVCIPIHIYNFWYFLG